MMMMGFMFLKKGLQLFETDMKESNNIFKSLDVVTNGEKDMDSERNLKMLGVVGGKEAGLINMMPKRTILEEKGGNGVIILLILQDDKQFVKYKKFACNNFHFYL